MHLVSHGGGKGMANETSSGWRKEPSKAGGNDFDSRIAAAIRKELALLQPASSRWDKHRQGWLCGGLQGCQFWNGPADGACARCQLQWGHWKFDRQPEPNGGWRHGKGAIAGHRRFGEPLSPAAQTSPITKAEPPPWKKSSKSMAPSEREGSSKRSGGRQANGDFETPLASPTSSTTHPEAMEGVEVAQQPFDVAKLRSALAAVTEALGNESPEALAMQATLDSAMEAKRAATPTHVLLLKVERRIMAVEAKLEVAHSKVDEIDRQLEELQSKRDEVFEQGRQTQTALEALLQDKAAILLQGQSQMAQVPPPEALDLHQLFGIAAQQVSMHPSLGSMFQQMQVLVEQIRAQAGQVAGPASGISATQLDDMVASQEAALQAAAAASNQGQQEIAQKKEGRPVRPRPSPYPAVPAPKEEQLGTQPCPSTGRELGFEGTSAEEFDSLLDGGQQLP